MGVTREDVVLGFLPAFHSFGLTITALLPLLVGVRVVHHPDPTDAVDLVHKIAAYGRPCWSGRRPSSITSWTGPSRATSTRSG